MKYIIVGLLITLLTGCGCFSVVSCVTKDDFTDMSDVQAFQYKNTIGHTNPTKRKEAFYDCGISKHSDLDDPVWRFNNVEGNRLTRTQCFSKYKWHLESCEDLDDKFVKIKKIKSCLNQKGYFEMDCGTKAKPTGFCN